MTHYEHVTGTFIGKGGIEIFYQKWIAPKSKHVIILSHGLGEHSGRYGNIIRHFEGKNVSFYAIDHRGHGNSGGSRGHIDEFNDYLYDLKLFYNFIAREQENSTISLFGHSLGGVIACIYALTYPEDLHGLILSAPAALVTAEVPAWKDFLGNKLSNYIPRFSTSNGLNPEDLSSDRTTVMEYIEDPLVHDRVTSRFYTEFAKAGKNCLIRCYELKMPLIIVHGADDSIVSFLGSERIYENASSPKKEYYKFDGLRHETLNERPEDRVRVLDLIERWFEKNIVPMSRAIKKAAKPVQGDQQELEKKIKKSSPGKKSTVRAGVSAKAKKTSADKKAASTAKKTSTVKKKTDGSKSTVSTKGSTASRKKPSAPAKPKAAKLPVKTSKSTPKKTASAGKKPTAAGSRKSSTAKKK